MTGNILAEQRSSDSRVFAEIEAVCTEVRRFLLDVLGVPEAAAGEDAETEGS